MKQKLPTIVVLITVVALMSCGENKSGFYDQSAIQALDKLSETIGNLSSASFTINTEIVTNDGATDTIVKQSDVYLSGSNQMYVYFSRADVRKGYWYKDAKLSVLDFDHDQYDEVPAPATIMETIDSIHNRYNIDFPAADFLYPTLTDDLMAQFDTIAVLGSKVIDDVSCKEINATNANLDVYMLIDEATNLPKQLEIYHLGERNGETFIATYSNWRTNPNLPDELFEFSPPASSTKTSIFK